VVHRGDRRDGRGERRFTDGPRQNDGAGALQTRVSSLPASERDMREGVARLRGHVRVRGGARVLQRASPIGPGELIAEPLYRGAGRLYGLGRSQGQEWGAGEGGKEAEGDVASGALDASGLEACTPEKRSAQGAVEGIKQHQASTDDMVGCLRMLRRGERST